jgi:hypothetical protein
MKHPPEASPQVRLGDAPQMSEIEEAFYHVNEALKNGKQEYTIADDSLTKLVKWAMRSIQ